MAANSKAIVRAQRPTDQLIISADPQQVAERLKLMIAGGKKLQTDEALALAQYSIATQLNPFEGECYYLPSVGPGPGIAGYRRRATEQLWFEAERAGVQGETVYYWFEHIPLTEETPFFHPSKGDIGYRAVLHDSLTKEAWEGRILKHMLTIKAAGFDSPKDCLEAAQILVGAEPTWSAEAVVYNDEQFAAPGRRDKWNRDERCQKRAEKWALRKRFNLNIPEPANFDVDVIEGEIRDVTNEPRASAAEIMGKLGYDDNPHPPPRQAPPPTTNGGDRPYIAEVLRNRIAEVSNLLEQRIRDGKEHAPSDTDRKVLASVLGTNLDGDETARHATLKYLTGFSSTKDLTPGTVLALMKWLEVKSFGDVPPSVAITETRAAYAAALMEQGQLELTIPSDGEVLP